MSEGKQGTIVQISSTASTMVRPGIAHYGSAKAGLSMLTRVLAVEWAKYGIRVNAVGPGLVITETGEEMLKNSIEQHRHAQKLRRIPLGWTADPVEIAHSVSFLVSERAAYITGQTLFVDGGYTAGSAFQDVENASHVPHDYADKCFYK
ncbi:SDR family NAD(P)-dependent oxidoreductase [Alicyclobacillus suci]|uniref:SDR family NAD(P)-dependent oxidoreductase n=1 Tax=Alicyclobacillus suci TaxID=2816080 RepID=UPI002E2DB264|nr:SDR family oxidoreductase [Alicyclobacillus suci]